MCRNFTVSNGKEEAQDSGVVRSEGGCFRRIRQVQSIRQTCKMESRVEFQRKPALIGPVGAAVQLSNAIRVFGN